MQQPVIAKSQPTVYFDGACPLCVREIRFYRSCRGASDIQWVDVTAVNADAFGSDLTSGQALARFHVRNEQGKLIAGARAFNAIWSWLTNLKWLATLFDNRLGHWLLYLAYRAFLMLRPFIPRRDDPACNDKRCA